MFPFNARASKVESQDRIAWRLLDAPASERPLVLMSALQRGELGLSEACDVLSIVNRIESLSQPIRRQAVIAADAPYWQQTGRRFIF